MSAASRSSIASVITQLAAAVGNDHVTFGINRTQPIWVDGSPVVLTPGGVVASLLRDLLQEQLNGIKGKLVFGAGVPTFEAYRELVGEYRGLCVALELIDEAESQANKHERGL